MSAQDLSVGKTLAGDVASGSWLVAFYPSQLNSEKKSKPDSEESLSVAGSTFSRYKKGEKEGYEVNDMKIKSKGKGAVVRNFWKLALINGYYFNDRVVAPTAAAVKILTAKLDAVPGITYRYSGNNKAKLIDNDDYESVVRVRSAENRKENAEAADALYLDPLGNGTTVSQILIAWAMAKAKATGKKDKKAKSDGLGRLGGVLKKLNRGEGIDITDLRFNKGVPVGVKIASKSTMEADKKAVNFVKSVDAKGKTLYFVVYRKEQLLRRLALWKSGVDPNTPIQLQSTRKSKTKSAGPKVYPLSAAIFKDYADKLISFMANNGLEHTDALAPAIQASAESVVNSLNKKDKSDAYERALNHSSALRERDGKKSKGKKAKAVKTVVSDSESESDSE